MSSPILHVLLDGQEIGWVERRAQGRLAFTYRDDWRSSSAAYPLSVSLPLAASEHGHAAIDAFLWGLLPDNELVVRSWASRFQVSARNAFGLLSCVGEDCAGAVQLVRPDRLGALAEGSEPRIEWLDEGGVAERLRALRADASAWRMSRDAGQFSLAGAQPKTALLLQGGRWGVPSGRVPTTHILKPPLAGLDGHAENEHLCLALARELGLPAASSEVRRFLDEVAIVVERYDRLPAPAGGARILRIHQEDLCQALGLPPTAKYQNEGGPGPADIAVLLRAHSSRPAEDVRTFADAIAFNWLIGGTDAHAKNYSLLHGGGGQVRLAPLYDLASALPYPSLDLHRLKLAMKLGGEYRLRSIHLHHWRKLAAELRLDPEETIERVAAMAMALPDHVAAVRQRAAQDTLDHPIIVRLCDALIERAQRCLPALRAEA